MKLFYGAGKLYQKHPSFKSHRHITVQDRAHNGSIVYRCSRKNLKGSIRERQQKNTTKAKREQEAKDKPEQLLGS